MVKIIISEKQYKAIREYLTENIDPRKAYTNMGAIKTVMNRERTIGFLGGGTKNDYHILDMSDLKVIPLHKNNACVFYIDGHEEEAQRLANIARKHGGFLPSNTPEETYEIGMLLGYYEDKVKEFVLKKFPDFKFY